jgi:ribonuclease P protein component
VGYRLTKRHRLLTSAEFSAVFTQPDERVSARHLLILAKTNIHSQARLGLVISRKNVGCAVARNRVKRLCRETFRIRLAGLAHADIVVLARNGLSNLDNAATVAMLNGLLDQLSERYLGRARRAELAPSSPGNNAHD